jgi:hypothetical protein
MKFISRKECYEKLMEVIPKSKFIECEDKPGIIEYYIKINGRTVNFEFKPKIHICNVKYGGSEIEIFSGEMYVNLLAELKKLESATNHEYLTKATQEFYTVLGITQGN